MSLALDPCSMIVILKKRDGVHRVAVLKLIANLANLSSAVRILNVQLITFIEASV